MTQFKYFPKAGRCQCGSTETMYVGDVIIDEKCCQCGIIIGGGYTTDQHVVREVKLTDAELTLHIPVEFDDIHEAIEEVLGARHVNSYTIAETYTIEEW